MGVNAVLFEQFRHGIIKRLERPPAPVQKVVAASVQFPPRRHARHAGHIGAVEGDAPLREALEIGRMHPIAPIGRQQMSIEGIEHHHDCFHGDDVHSRVFCGASLFPASRKIPPFSRRCGLFFSEHERRVPLALKRRCSAGRPENLSAYRWHRAPLRSVVRSANLQFGYSLKDVGGQRTGIPRGVQIFLEMLGRGCAADRGADQWVAGGEAEVEFGGVRASGVSN